GTGGALKSDYSGLDVDAIHDHGVGFLVDGVSFKMVLARGTSVDSDVNVTKFEGDQSEVTIAVNPTNPKNIIVAPVDDAASNGVFGTTRSRDHVWVSTDGGLTF